MDITHRYVSVSPSLDFDGLAFRIADLTMIMALDSNISLEDATLLLISRFEEEKHLLNEYDRILLSKVVAEAAKQLREVIR